MKFLADENIDKPIVTRLRADGYIVFYDFDTPKTKNLYG
jgi:hypothetical protein